MLSMHAGLPKKEPQDPANALTDIEDIEVDERDLAVRGRCEAYTCFDMVDTID